MLVQGYNYWPEYNTNNTLYRVEQELGFRSSDYTPYLVGPRPIHIRDEITWPPTNGSILYGSIGTRLALVTSSYYEISWDEQMYYAGNSPWEMVQAYVNATLVNNEFYPCPVNQTCDEYFVTYWIRQKFVCAHIMDCTDTVGWTLYLLDPLYYEPPEPVAVLELTVTYRENTTVVLVYVNIDGLFCSYRKKEWTVMALSINGICTLNVPNAAHSVSDYRYLYVLNSTEVVWEDQKWDAAVHLCDLYGSIFCCSRHNWTCAFLYSPYWWLLLVLMLILLLFWFVPCTLLFLVYALKLLAAVMYLCYSSLCCCGKCCHRKVVSKYRGKYSQVKLSSLALAMCMPFAFGCDVGGVITASTYSCTDYTPPGQREQLSCLVELDVQVTLPFVGATACLTITDGADMLFGTMNITYLDSTDVVALASQYYTGWWDMIDESKMRCYDAGGCPDTCDDMNPNTVNPGGELHGPLTIDWPGYSRCIRSCKCSTCGCFYCHDGCIYSRVAVMPHNSTVFNVLNPTSMHHTFHLNISYAGVDGTSFVTYVENTEYSEQGFVFHVLGGLVGDTVVFGTNKIIVNLDNGDTWLHAASDVDTPLVNSIGDLQADQIDYYLLQTPDAFIFDFPSIDYTRSEKSVSYVSPPPGLKLLSTAQKLPSLVGSSIMYYDQGRLYGQNLAPGAVVVQVTTLEDLHFGTYVSSICPRAVSSNCTGCFHCQTGASCDVILFSDCQDGLALVTSTGNFDLITSSALCLFAGSTQTIRISPTVAHTVGVLTFSSKGLISSINIDFEAFDATTIITPNYTISNTTSNDYKGVNNWDLFGKWFNLPHWLDIVLDILLYLAVILVAALIISVVIYAVYRYIMYRKHRTFKKIR